MTWAGVGIFGLGATGWFVGRIVGGLIPQEPFPTIGGVAFAWLGVVAGYGLWG